VPGAFAPRQGARHHVRANTACRARQSVEADGTRGGRPRGVRRRALAGEAHPRRARRDGAPRWTQGDRAVHAAWLTAAPRLSPIEPERDYWKEEVESVIKGRGFTRFEQYADCARVGRRRPLGIDQRRAVWDLF